MKNKLANLEKNLEYTFKDKNLLIKALTHTSSSQENNEVLEFLGDSVLNLIVTELLLEKFPNAEVFNLFLPDYFDGSGTFLKYGFTVSQPSGYIFLASSSFTAGRITTSSPFFQFAGVATLCFAVSCIESIALKIS